MRTNPVTQGGMFMPLMKAGPTYVGWYNYVTFVNEFRDYSAYEIYEKFTIPSSSKSRGTLIFYDYEADGRMNHVTTILNDDSMLHK